MANSTLKTRVEDVDPLCSVVKVESTDLRTDPMELAEDRLLTAEDGIKIKPEIVQGRHLFIISTFFCIFEDRLIQRLKNY